MKKYLLFSCLFLSSSVFALCGDAVLLDESFQSSDGSKFTVESKPCKKSKYANLSKNSVRATYGDVFARTDWFYANKNQHVQITSDHGYDIVNGSDNFVTYEITYLMKNNPSENKYIRHVTVPPHGTATDDSTIKADGFKEKSGRYAIYAYTKVVGQDGFSKDDHSNGMLVIS